MNRSPHAAHASDVFYGEIFFILGENYCNDRFITGWGF